MNTNATKWTPEQRKERSKIDYVITSQEYLETIKIMETVEEKQNGSYKIKRQIKQIKKTELWSQCCTNKYRLY